MDSQFYITADLASLGYERWRFYYRFIHPIAHFERQLRLAEKWQKKNGHLATLVGKWREIRCRRLSMRMGAAIHPGVAGPGLSIAHIPGIVINKRARIGKNCRLHQNVTIGSAGGLAPRIGDNVWIGAGAVIVGDVTVGDRSIIGANAVVTRDVPAGVTVAGVPAKVISSRASDVPDGCAIAARILGISDPTLEDDNTGTKGER